jgi:type II secretory pathway pseudopilin PulG
MAIKRVRRLAKSKADAGFTLLEVIIAVVMLTVGVIGLLAAFAASVATLNQSREDSIARQEAQQFIEGIYAARNSASLNFNNFQNVSQDPANGLFKDGMQPANQAGPDGLMNTADDLADLETGPNGKPLPLQRKIEFTPFFLPGPPPVVDPNMRQIAITIQYGNGSQKRTYQEVTYISSYR